MKKTLARTMLILSLFGVQTAIAKDNSQPAFGGWLATISGQLSVIAKDYLNPVRKMANSWISHLPEHLGLESGKIFSGIHEAQPFVAGIQSHQTNDMSHEIPSSVGKNKLMPTALFASSIIQNDDDATGYIKIATGNALNLELPEENSKKDLKDLYNMVVAIQNFSGYNLSHMYAERKKIVKKGPFGAKITSQDSIQSLLQKSAEEASTVKFYAGIEAEPLGAVMRKNLMYNAQSYLMLYRIQQTQEKLLASISMMNSLLATSLYKTLGAIAKASNSRDPNTIAF